MDLYHRALELRVQGLTEEGIIRQLMLEEDINPDHWGYNQFIPAKFRAVAYIVCAGLDRQCFLNWCTINHVITKPMDIRGQLCK